MSNPFAGIITATHKELFNNMIYSLLEDTALTVPCKLIYGDTKFVECENCIINNMTGRSANKYKALGPVPFNDGQICPYCNGQGKKAVESSESGIYIAVIWDYKHFYDAPAHVNVSSGHIQTLTKLSLLSKIKQTKEILVNTDLEEYVKHRFIRDGEPNPAGWGDNEFAFTLWKRA